MSRIAVVYNQASGNGGSTKQAIQKAFKPYKHSLKFIEINKNIAKDLAQAIKAGAEVLVAAGGDGTVNAVAQAAVSNKMTMGILPLGTLNHFAKDVGLPMDINEAAKIINKNNTTKLDYGTVNDKVFINNSSVGMYPKIVRNREKLSSKFGKWPAAIIATIKISRQAKTYRLRLVMDTTERTFKTPLIFVGNNPYQFKKIGFTSRTKLTTGKLFIYVIRTNRLVSMLGLAFTRFIGKRLRNRDYLNKDQTGLVIHSAKKTLQVAVDGEVILIKTPLQYKIHPRGLSVLT